MLRPAAFARATHSGSTYLKQYSEIAGTFARNINAAEPAGEMSSVDTLSPSFSRTGASSVSVTGSPSGTGFMFVPRTPLPRRCGSPQPPAPAPGRPPAPRERAAARLGDEHAGADQIGEELLARHRLEDPMAAREQ